MRRLLLIVVIGLGIAATSWFAAMAVADGSSAASHVFA